MLAQCAGVRPLLDWVQVSLSRRKINRTPRGSALVVLVLLGMILVPVECDAATQVHSIFLSPSAVRAYEQAADPLAHHSEHGGVDAKQDSATGTEQLIDSAQTDASSASIPAQPIPVKSTAVDHTPVVLLLDIGSQISRLIMPFSVATPGDSLVGIDIRPEPLPPRFLSSPVEVSV